MGKKGRGRPRIVKMLRELAQQDGLEAYNNIVEIMRNGESDKIQLAAAQEILNRGYGRPMQAVEITGEEGAPLPVLCAQPLTTEEFRKLYELGAGTPKQTSSKNLSKI